MQKNISLLLMLTIHWRKYFGSRQRTSAFPIHTFLFRKKFNTSKGGLSNILDIVFAILLCVQSEKRTFYLIFFGILFEFSEFFKQFLEMKPNFWNVVDFFLRNMRNKSLSLSFWNILWNLRYKLLTSCSLYMYRTIANYTTCQTVQ